MSGRMSANDPGRVKTPTLAARVETFWRNYVGCMSFHTGAPGDRQGVGGASPLR